MARRTYWVSPRDGSWSVSLEGGAGAIKIFDLKDDAIQRARELALNNQPSQVIVQGRDGKIQTEWTYGNDPFPPAG